jgi:phosphate-selective porin
VVRRSDAALVLDAGAVIGLARGSSELRAIGATARDAAINLTLGQFSPHRPLDEPTSRLAGELLGAAGSSSTIDAHRRLSVEPI